MVHRIVRYAVISVTVVFRASLLQERRVSLLVSENTYHHVGDCRGFHQKGFSVSVADSTNTFSKENAHR
jgi:hypothetical protein